MFTSAWSVPEASAIRSAARLLSSPALRGFEEVVTRKAWRRYRVYIAWAEKHQLLITLRTNSIYRSLLRLPISLALHITNRDVCLIIVFTKPMDDNRSFVYSAYIDDRPAPDVNLKELPVVRILAAIPRGDVRNGRKLFRCIFWFENKDWSVETHVIRITDMNKFDQKLP